MTGQVARVVVHAPGPPSCTVRVEDLPVGCCFEKEGVVCIKQENGYCLSLEDFISFQIRPMERVDALYRTVRIVVE